jgi:hypothetical protein
MCRRCYGLAYASQQESARFRAPRGGLPRRERPIRGLPNVLVYPSGGGYKMKVEGTEEAVARKMVARSSRPRGYGRPAQSLDLHLSADAITKRLSDMTDAELAALEQRMIAAAPIVLEATAEASDDAGELTDGDVEDSPPDAPA